MLQQEGKRAGNCALCSVCLYQVVSDTQSQIQEVETAEREPPLTGGPLAQYLPMDLFV